MKCFFCHDFIAKEQSPHIKSLKNQWNDGEFLVIYDFAKKYAFFAQDAAQGFHWYNAQATSHRFVIYYRNDGKVKQLIICVISYCLKHDSTIDGLFQNVLHEYLKANFTVKKNLLLGVKLNSRCFSMKTKNLFIVYGR